MNDDMDVTEQSLRSLSPDRASLLALLVERKLSERDQLKPQPRGSGVVRFPTSWAQQRLWFIDQLEEGKAAYNLPLTVRIHGPLDHGALRRALDHLVQRHEVLRTVITDSEGDACQEIHPQGRFALREIELHGDAEQREREIYAQRLLEVREPFDLSAGPLIRGRLLTVASEDHVLTITIHHIIADGWSVGVLVRELTELYNAYHEQRGPNLAPLRVQYADYAVWQREWLQGMVLERQLAYWRQCLRDAPAEIELPKDRGRQATQGYRGQYVPLSFDARLGAQLSALASRHGLTLFMVLYAAWAILLARLSGQDDILVGTPLANRRRAELEPLIGFFVNTVVLRAGVSPDMRLGEFLGQVRQNTLAAFDHQDLPFEQLVEALRPERNLNRHPIFQAMFVLQNAPQSELRLTELAATLQPPIIESSKFDVLLELGEWADGIAGGINFDSDLFDRSTIERWGSCLRTLLESMVAMPEERIGNLPILSAGDRELLSRFNATQTTFRLDRPIHELVEAQVERSRDAVALVHGERSWTYAELNARANQLARYLREHGARKDQVVGICTERSFEMIAGVVAILKAGAAYLPLDPSYPPERLQFMIEDTAPPVVLTQERLLATVPAGGARIAVIDGDSLPFAAYDTGNLGADEGDPGSLLYVIYTSGSTGRPKGTAMPHRAMANLIEWHRATLPAAGKRVLQFAALSFDVAFQEIFSTLATGGTLVLLDEWVRHDAGALLELLNRQHVERLFVPPLMLQSLSEQCGATGIVPSVLCDVITAGEQLRISSEIVRLFEQLGTCRLHNHYGPTETHVVTALTLTGMPEKWTTLPSIGQPIANTRIYVLDAQLQPVPVGVAGEIYIAGANLACGYLHRPELTAERFMRDPFVCDPQARMYKTGDLGRWRPDGTIDYLGRNDDQVKIRGFRIELGEISSRLASHPTVREAAVCARNEEGGDKRLVAYLTCKPGSRPTAEQLRAHLKAALPSHMIPGAFVILDELPLTPSGKLNRRALPAPDQEAFASERYEPPRGAVEQALGLIWQESLGIGRVGRSDSFFELGGHSLLALKVLFKINQTFASTLRVADVYRNPTLRELAGLINGADTEDPLVDLTQEAALADDLVVLPGAPQLPAETLLLTGATGFVGRFLLAQLLEETAAKIYCLVRARSQHEANARLKGMLHEWDLWRMDCDARLIAVRGDLRMPGLGIDAPLLQRLVTEVDAIYHCGTSMNHLETYGMARPANVQAAHELLRLATRGRPKLLNYISTLGVFAPRAGGVERTVYETTGIEAERHRSSRGYVASKWVGEQIFLNAARRGVACNVFRLGLVWADSALGRYDELQRGYRILASALLSGYGIENYRYEMPPTPVDYCARAIVWLSLRHAAGGGIFHISARDHWPGGLFERCNRLLRNPLELLPYHDWICTIKRLHDAGCSLPVVPLVDFAFSMHKHSFERYMREFEATKPRFDCSRTQGELDVAGIFMPPVDDEMLQACIEAMLARDPKLREAVPMDVSLPAQSPPARSRPDGPRVRN